MSNSNNNDLYIDTNQSGKYSNMKINPNFMQKYGEGLRVESPNGERLSGKKVIEYKFDEYTFRSSFKFNKDGLVISISSMVKNVTEKNYTEGEKLGMDIKASTINLSHDETKQLANFIVKHYKGIKPNAV